MKYEFGKIYNFECTGQAGYTGDRDKVHLAQLNGLEGVFVDEHDNIFIADTYNHRIRRVDIYYTLFYSETIFTLV